MVKKIVTLSLMILVVVSCNNLKENKAKNLIKKQLKETLNDYSSYEPVEFSKLEVKYSMYFQDSLYKIVSKKHDRKNEYIKEAEITIEKANEFNERIGYIADTRGIATERYLPKVRQELDSLSVIQDSIRKNYKPQMDGYYMTHKLRAKNALGAMMLTEMIFFFDKDLTKVTEDGNAEKYLEAMELSAKNEKQLNDLDEAEVEAASIMDSIVKSVIENQ